MKLDQIISEILRQRPTITQEELLIEIGKRTANQSYKISTAPKYDSIVEEVEAAYDLEVEQAEQVWKRALKRDPNCLEAYEGLASIQISPETALKLYLKAIRAGRKRFNGSYMEEHKGHFWLMSETRPFMRCLMEAATVYNILLDFDHEIALLKEMLELNPNDNQGARYPLIIAYLRQGQTNECKKIISQFSIDDSTFMHLALFCIGLIEQPDDPSTHSHLKKARQKNLHWFKLILDPETEGHLPESYTLGSHSEGMMLCFQFAPLLQDNMHFQYYLRKNKVR